MLISRMKLAPKLIFFLLAWTGAWHAPVAGGQGELDGSIRSPHPSSPSKNPQIWRWLRPGESGGFSRPVGGGIGANAVVKRTPVTRILRLWVSPASRKRRRGSRRSRTPPRRAHDTLQPQDESIIVGYYTSAEVHSPKAARISTALVGEKGVLWQEATVSIVPAQET